MPSIGTYLASNNIKNLAGFFSFCISSLQGFCWITGCFDDDNSGFIHEDRSGHYLIFFPLCTKSLICLEGKLMTPHRGALFSSVPPSNSLVSVSDPPRDCTRTLLGPSTRFVRCFQIYRDTRTPSTTTDANLDCAFVENALVYTDPWFWKVNRIELC